MVKLMSRNLRMAGLLVMFCLAPCASPAWANDAEVETAVNSYLASLANGDVAVIEGLIGGPMAERAKRSLSDPDRYGAFLREQYDRVLMTVVSVSQVGDNYRVAVQFDYPAGNSDQVVLLLSNEHGAWKVIDELQ